MITGKENMITRQAAVAGKFYPASGKQLRSEVENMLKTAKQPVRTGQSPQAIVVPHAGYVFSGMVAASAFNQIDPGNHPTRVFVLASSHQMHFAGASVYCVGNYETPLGIVKVNCEIGNQLTKKNALFTKLEEAHLHEHSLEVQLPFLQVILGDSFELVPVILGTHRPEECERIAASLIPWFVPENLFVFSSDFSHYPCYEDAVKTDRATTEAILTNSPERLLSVLEKNRMRKITGLATSLCGWTSVLTMLYLTNGKDYSFEWIDYRNSGDQPLYGNHDRVVGYSAIAVFEEKENKFRLSDEEKEKLLVIAGESAREMVNGGRRNPINESLATGNLALRAGAFVSLYVAGILRGCIGSFEEECCLAETINRVAASATHDGRFKPVEEKELKKLTIEISVLTPRKRIKSPDEIVIGKHGIYMKKGWSSGTFLPQVPIKYGWSLEEFLGHCARDKAGIGWEGWKSAELFTYEAIIFSSGQMKNLIS